MRVLKYALVIVCCAALLLVFWGVAIEPRLIDREAETATIPGLPAAWAGRQVAQMSDFQVGIPLANTDTMRRMVGQLVEDRPALVLISGDFIYHPGEDPTGEIRTAVEIVRPLPAANIPTYAVLGNHDYGMPTRDAAKRAALAGALRRALEEAGVVVLHNEAVPLAAPGGQGAPLYLVGIGPAIPDEARPAAALGQVPDGAPRLVMMHNPDTFGGLPAGTAPLAVAGHTHGGQVRVPFTPEWSWMRLTQGGAVHADGWIEDYGAAGNRLYVNRGVGFSVAPIRLFCPPELTIFTLRGTEP